jgi:hypothetical protein
MARPSADRLEREAENNATYYGSTTTSATPAIPRRPAPAAPAVIPGEDFSEAGAYRRAFNEVSYQSSQDYYADFPSTNPTTNPRAISAIMRYRKANATKLIFSQIPATLERYPSLVTALAEADFDENDAKRLINLAEMDTAFDAITSTEDPARQRNIVVSMNPVQRAAFFDFFMAKAEELQREAAQNPSWAESAWNGFYGAIVEPIFDGLLFANETAQRTARAAMLAAEDNPVGAALGATPLGVANTAVMVSAYWDQAGPGMYDQEYIDGLKGEFGAAPVDTLLRLEELKRDGEPDPYGRWVSEYVGTDQENLVRDVTWSKYADPEMLQLARLINTASQDNTGMVLLSNLPEDFRDNAIYDLTAGAANVVAAFALDPTIVGAKVLQSYRAARYSLLKLSSAPGIDDAFRMRRTRLFYDSLGDDFARLENLTPQKRAVARDTIRRQRGNYLPPQVIDEMEAAGVRSADDANRWFTSKYVAESILTGINVGDRFGTTFEQMWRATNLAKRSPLMPGKTTAGVIRSRFRLLAAIHNPVNTRFAAGFAQRFDEAGEFIPGSTLDASVFGSRLSDEAFSYGAEQGAIPRRGPLGDLSRSVAGRQPEEAGKKKPLVERAGAALGYRYADKSVQARLDRISRRFARAPMPSAVYMNDGRDAGMIYDWSRVFLTRQDAALVSDIWRSAPNQAVRKQIFNGLVKTHAAAKGVTLRDPTKSWREFLPEVKRGGVYSPTLTMRRREDGLLVWDRGEDASLANVEDAVSVRPSVFDGQEYPLHLWQTSDFVKIPSFVDIEQAGVKASFLGAMFGVTQGQVAQKIVDGWSLLNLAGPRYFLRNALEDYVFYAMTAGQWKNVYKGRRFASALRDVRGEKLGIVNRQFRGRARPIDDPDFRTKWDLIKSNFTEEDRVAAMTAMRDGDLSKIRDLVALSMARTKLTGWTQANQDDLMDFVTEHGAKLLDEVNETAMYGTSAMFPTIQSTSYQVLVDPSDGAISARIVRPSRKWGDVSPNSDNPLVLSSWLRDIQGVADLDGAIGKIAILGLPESDDVLIPRIAQAIRDDKQFKYTERLAAFHTAGATPEAFAARYIADVRNMFSKPDGSLNSELRSKVIALDPERGAFVRGADLTVKDLAEIGFRDRPQFVLGRAAADGDEVATLNSIKGFDKLWSIMGAQYARISREPIFLANYLEQRTLLRPYEETMAGMFGRDVAKARASKMATDRAYELTLSYTDNPRNRTLLAWNSRNVARYYRATEDFARRALRVGKNYPEGFWKVGLTYDVLEDTGFVFTDENNEDYFVFPGTELAIGLVNKAIQMHPRFQGSGVLQMDSASYEMRGNVRMLSPSADVQQWLPTYSSPISAIAIKSIIAAFPAFESFEQALLGDYSEGADFWRSVLPGHANRAWSAMDRNERYSSYSSTFKDAVQVSAAAGAMPGPDAPQEEWDKYSSGLDVLVTTLLVTRAVLGLGLPAAPKLTANDVTDFARSGGILNMDAAFREMIRVAQAEGSQNPFADGIVKYVETFGLDSVPYSLSTTESNDRFGSLNDLSSVSATEEGEKWVKEHGDLTSGRFKTAAAWLMPRMGKYSTDQATWLRKAGYKIPSTYSDIFEKARIVEGRYVMLQNREAAETDISAAKKRYYDAVNVGNQAAIEESWAEVRTLEDSWQDIQKQIKGDYPALESFGTTTEAIELNNESRKRLLDIEIRPMIEFLMNDREKDIPPGTENMQDAIATFDLYAGAISMIEGTTSAEDLDKRMMKIEAEQLLLEIGARDPNTQFFVELILIPILARTYVPPTGGS